MSIADQVKQDVLSNNYISLSLQSELDRAKQENLVSLKNDILLRALEEDQDIKLKYDQINDYITNSSFSINTLPDTIQQLELKKVELPKKRIILGQKVADHVKTVLQVLDVTWSIIEEFKHRYERDKNIQFDQHYTGLVDTLLIKVKILHITVLINTYDDQDFIDALESLKNLLELRFIDAQTILEYTTQQLKEYNDIGPEFKTLCNAYYDLLDRIRATKDDINRFKNG